MGQRAKDRIAAMDRPKKHWAQSTKIDTLILGLSMEALYASKSEGEY
jgi:hypothetical protein